MRSIRRSERTGELGIERASARKRHQLGEATRSQLTAPEHGYGPPTHGHSKLRADADGADREGMRLAIYLLVPVILFSGWQIVRREQNERGLALVASQVAQREVGVSCPGFWTRLVEITPNAGWVGFDENGKPDDKTQLSATTCSSLGQLRKDGPPAVRCLLAGSGACPKATLAAVQGMITLSHEAWHLRGVTGEAQTQCYAIQTIEQVARGFGFVPRDAALVATYAALDDARAPVGEYHSPECRPGGVFDLHRETPAWPSW